MFFHFRIKLKTEGIAYMIIVFLSNTEYSFLWEDGLWAQFCIVDMNRNCAINF